jgi:gliding motility-associated-like protein
VKRSYLYILWGCLCLGALTKVSASHIVGGEIYYDYIGSNNYKITLKIYRDCSSATQLDNPAFITIFDASNTVVTTLNLSLLSQTNVPPSINNPCIQTPNNVCVEEGIYEGNVNLPPKTGGYTIVYQRCCRNGSILNLVNPGGVGSTYWEHIPGPEVVTVNSCPRYKKFPPIFICNGIPIAFDHSATDPDGDQLVYSLCSPYNGLDKCCPVISNPAVGIQPCPSPPPSCPFFAQLPPYITVPFISPYNGAYPMSSSPAININSVNGFLNGTPNLNGQWVVGVCVQEFRGGNLIGTHYRDFQFNVVTCSVTVISAIQGQSQLCEGLTISFGNQSIGGSTFHWDFGVSGLTNDTSDIVSTTYTYPDTGRYTVTLIANPGKPCVDTSKQTFYVFPLLAPTFKAPPSQCITGNSFNFSVGGTFAPYTTFNWNFGPAATPSSSSILSPANVSFSVAGHYVVKVAVKEAVCRDTLVDTVIVYPRPKANFGAIPITSCDSSKVTIQNSVPQDPNDTYLWQFSDSSTSTDYSPSHIFSPPGVYNVTLTVTSHIGCIDTSRFIANNLITVRPKPRAAFSFSPTSTTIFDPDIYFSDESLGATSWVYTFGDGNSSTMNNRVNTYQNYGDFLVTQFVTNQFGCRDSIQEKVTILPEFRFWIPNSFTPGNKDGLNDVFLPIAIGTEEYEFYIYDRWGEKIFETKKPNEGWNGNYKGKLCEQDIYVWMIKFKNVVTLRREEHYGHVTLLK